MNRPCRWGVLVVCVTMLSVHGLSQELDAGYVYQRPEAIEGDWIVASLADVGIAEESIADAINLIRSGHYPRVHSLLLVKSGTLVLEEYFRGYTYASPTNWAAMEVMFGNNRIHNLASLTKSITSILVGAAIHNGFIQGVDEPALSYFPEFEDLRTPANDAITIEHLLTLTPGWEWTESTQMVEENCMVQFNAAPSPLRYLIGLPMVDSPGEHWAYNGGAVSLLGQLIEEASGLSVERFANRFLFDQLGIRLYRWARMQPDFIATHGDLKLLPRDVAKIGQLMLNDGVWNGVRLLPEGWVDASVSPSVHFRPGEGFYSYTDYGYLWWLMDLPIGGETFASYSAAGWGGQRLIVIPDLDVVVVFNGGNYDSIEPVDEIMTRHILPALTGG